jgi:phosphoribosylformylglycinamidine synthase
LAQEKANGDFVRERIARGDVSSVHDLSDGGLAVALAEMAMAGRIGAVVSAPGGDSPAAWFGEDQGRYLLAVPVALLVEAKLNGVAVALIGETGGGSLTLGSTAPLMVQDLLDVHENWMPAYMAGSRTD